MLWQQFPNLFTYKPISRVTHLLLFSLPDWRAFLLKLLFLWHHVLSTFPSSASTSSLHSYLTLPLLSLLLHSSPSAPFIFSSPAAPPCICCHAFLISVCFRYPISLPKLSESLAAFPECLWISLCPSPISLSVYPQTVQLCSGIALYHVWQNLLMAVFRFQEVKKSLSKEAQIFLDCSLDELQGMKKLGRWRVKFDHLLGILL